MGFWENAVNDDNVFRKIDLNLLLVFEAIYRTRNISHAATQLGMSQPTLSNALARLRVQLGNQLFTRLDRGVAPTNFADNIIHPIRQALSVLRTGLQPQTSFDYGNVERTFRVAMHSFAVHVLLPTLIDELIASAPGIRLDIQPPDWARPFDAVLSGEVDLIVDGFPHTEPQVQFEPLFDVQPVAIVRKGHPMIDGFLSRDTFSAVGHVFLGMPVRRVFQMEQALVLAGLNRRIVCELSSGSDLAQLVSRTNLVALVPLRYAVTVSELFNLQVLQLPFQYPTQKFIQGWHSQKEQDIGLAWLRSRIRQAAEATDVPFLPPHPEWPDS
jgi:DNA-binding transcriptional LysR family regulator